MAKVKTPASVVSLGEKKIILSKGGEKGGQGGRKASKKEEV